MEIGNRREWDDVARNVRMPQELREVNLWIDSFDVPKTNPKGFSKKDEEFSYKLNRYERRYIAIMDRNTKIRWLGGGYSPKVYDSTYMQIMRKELQRCLRGARMVADNPTAGDNWDDTKFFASYKNPASKKRGREGEGVAQLSKKKQRYNKSLKALRARVRNLLELSKVSFPPWLTWKESDAALDATILLAAAFHNRNNC